MKKNLCKILSVIILLVTFLVFLVGCKNETMVKADDTAFTILQISDVHIKNNEKKDKKAFDTISLLVEKTLPNMIIVTGDITSEHENLKAIKTFAEFMENVIKIPWAFTYGNHDAEGETPKSEISEYLETLEYCIFEKGDENVFGEGNYYYNVKDNDGNVIQSLIMMDSNMYNPNKDEGGYDNFHEDQVAWYEKTIKDIALAVNGDEQKVVPSLAFFHIPFKEFTVAYDKAKESKSILYGKRREKVASGYNDDLMFEKMLELDSTRGVFVGHDHMNDFSVEYKGIRFTYPSSADHNIYLVPNRGGCLISIKNDGGFTNQNVYHPRFSNYIKLGEEV